MVTGVKNLTIDSDANPEDNIMITLAESKWILNTSVFQLLLSTMILSVVSPLLIAYQKGWFNEDIDDSDDCCKLSKKDLEFKETFQILDDIVRLLQEKDELGNYEIEEGDSELNKRIEDEEVKEIENIKNEINEVFKDLEAFSV